MLQPGDPRQAEGDLSRGGSPKRNKTTSAEDRWQAFLFVELLKRDQANLEILSLRDKSLEDGDDLPEPDVLAMEIAAEIRARKDTRKTGAALTA